MIKRGGIGRAALSTGALIMCLVIIAVGGCDGENGPPPDEVTVQLKWLHQAQFAGFYAADQERFYEDAGLEASLLPKTPGSSTSDVVSRVVDREITFAVVGGEQLLIERSKGQPVVAIAAIFQKNPNVYVTMQSSGIARAHDLVGKRVMMVPDGVPQHEAVFRNIGIDPGTVETVTDYEYGTAALVSGRVDAFQAYRTGSALLFEAEGHDVNYIWFEDYGVSLYADTIITSESLIEENPDLVQRFLQATLAGWRYAIENLEAAVDFTMKYDPELARGYQRLMAVTQNPLIHTGEVEIGWMEQDVWQGMEEMMNQAGLLAQPIDVTRCYTMQFLNEVYGTSE